MSSSEALHGPASWLGIASAPKDKDLLLAIDSYDCGWVYDSGVFSDSESGMNLFSWKSIHTIEESFLNMPYTHWLIPTFENLSWKSISLAPKDKVVILGSRKSNGNEMDFCVCWWLKDINGWVSGVSGDPLSREFDYFATTEDSGIAFP
jgi:hypothetical protein